MKLKSKITYNNKINNISLNLNINNSANTNMNTINSLFQKCTRNMKQINIHITHKHKNNSIMSMSIRINIKIVNNNWYKIILVYRKQLSTTCKKLSILRTNIATKYNNTNKNRNRK